MTDPIQIGGLAAALDLPPRGVTALVGGGGKTTMLFALGRQLTGTIVLSTTTKMGSDRTGGFEPLSDPDDAELSAALARDRVVLCWNGIDDHRALGFPPDDVEHWMSLADHVIVEADGSRRRPFKAPAAHEPVVPTGSATLIACVGAAALNRPIRDVCHRPELTAAVAGCGVGDDLDADRLARVLVDSAGSRKGCPPGARFVVVVNQVTERHRSSLVRLEELLGAQVPLIAIAPFGPDDSPEV